MNFLKELNHDKGFIICDVENIKNFKKLRDSFIKNIKIPIKEKKNINQVRKFLAGLSKSDINKSMIDFLTFNKNLSEMMVNSFPSIIKSLCGNELFIQRRAHTTINVPGLNQAKQVAHFEMISGISPFTYIIWAPLHDIDDNGGAYHIDLKSSLKLMKEGEKKGLVNGPEVLDLMGSKKPPRLKFGQAILFNPFVLHGNIPFFSKYARIACNVRFQSSKKPLLQKNTEYLRYYKLS